MTTMYGVDLSYDDLTPAEAIGLREAGVEVVAQCLWTGVEQPRPRVSNLRSAIAAGLTVMGYISVSSGRGGAEHAEAGRAGVPDDIWDQLVHVVTDVELPGISNETIRDCVERLVELGKPRAIYTSYGHWTGNQQNTTEFADCLLWNALWDGLPDIDFASLPYGGWSYEKLLGEQWSGGTYVRGVFVDRNTFIRENVFVPRVEVEEMTKEQVEELLAAQRTELLGYIGNLLKLGARHGELINALGGGLAAVARTVAQLQALSPEGVNTTIGLILDDMATNLEALQKKVAAHTSASREAAQVILDAER